jgi:hypothetical protein
MLFRESDCLVSVKYNSCFVTSSNGTCGLPHNQLLYRNMAQNSAASRGCVSSNPCYFHNSSIWTYLFGRTLR